MHRDEHGFHTLIVQDPVFVEKTKDKREDIRRTTQVLTKCIEDHVRRYPEEWFWLHNRWKWTDRLHPELKALKEKH